MQEKYTKNDELEGHIDSFEDNQQDIQENQENALEAHLEVNMDEMIGDNNDIENNHATKIIPKEYNDHEFDQLSKTEQNKIVFYNISSFIGLVLFLLIVLFYIL